MLPRASTLPPAAVTTCFTIASPRPVPREARARSLMVALAGRISAEDLSFAYEAGAEIAGVRGAACECGREGPVREERVRALVAARDRLHVHRGDSYSIAREITRETSFQ